MGEAVVVDPRKNGAGVKPVPCGVSIGSTRFIAVISSILMLGCQALAHVALGATRAIRVAMWPCQWIGFWVRAFFSSEHHREPLAKLLERRLIACPLQNSSMGVIGELQSVFG
jgi:hypothetical protein